MKTLFICLLPHNRMRGLLIIPLLFVLAAWDLGSNHGQFTLPLVEAAIHVLRALGLGAL